ncbi:MAG: hypothetical protein HY526_10485 [Betaproteobacteria bacterium]|nr:hypothetical protein [Betaproteobacteria bacterium]
MAVLLFLAPLVVHAVGMGRLTVLSTLGHPLLAEIELISVQQDDLATLTARLASPDAYRQANLQYGPALAGMRLSIEQRPNGQPYIKVMSMRPINEPFVDLLIELNAASGRLTREYTALIDPPGYTAPQTVATAPPAVAETRPVPVPQAPVAVAAPSSAKAAGGSDYGPIKRGETLSRIAATVKPEGVSLDQMLVGIFRSNPEAFMNNNMNLMKAGKTLRIPDKDQVTAITPREAREEVRLQATDWNRYRRRLADTAGSATERKARAAKREPARVKVEDKAAKAKDAKHVLRLSPGEPPGSKAAKARAATERIQALEEELIAREKALNEANQRIKELEKAAKGPAK